MKRLVCITGGIGSGKSVVSRICRLKGYEVYDCDLRARDIMERSSEILSALRERFGEEAILDNGLPNRKHIASIVFSKDEERLWLNSIIHSEVRNDLRNFAASAKGDVCFVETAIPTSSELAQMCDIIWLVKANEDLRLARALARDKSADAADIRKRMESQRFEFDSLQPEKTRMIANEESYSLLAQIDELLKETKK